MVAAKNIQILEFKYAGVVSKNYIWDFAFVQ